MNIPRLRESSVLVVLLVICLAPSSAMAYIGPGGGLSALGALLAVVLAVILAIFGFVWYPIKRLYRKLKGPKQQDGEGEE